MIGPSCYLKLVDFETLSRQEALELKNGFGVRLILAPIDSANHSSAFCAWDLLSPEEKALYKRIKQFFIGRQKPTLKILAARLLRNSEKSYSANRLYFVTLKH